MRPILLSVTTPQLAPEQVDVPEADEDATTAKQWVTIVWNDPVNLMTYVTHVLQKLFGYDEPTATKLMLAVHHEGKAVVSTGEKESMEHDTARLHGFGLWATYQPA